MTNVFPISSFIFVRVITIIHQFGGNIRTKIDKLHMIPPIHVKNKWFYGHISPDSRKEIISIEAQLLRVLVEPLRVSIF